MTATPIRNRIMTAVDQALTAYVQDVNAHCDEMEKAVKASRDKAAKKLEAHLRGQGA